MIVSVFEPLSRALCKVCELRWHLQLPLAPELVAGSTRGMEKPENSARRDIVLLVLRRFRWTAPSAPATGACARDGCNMPSWNGQPGEFCSLKCHSASQLPKVTRCHMVGSTETTQNARSGVLAALDRGVDTGELTAALRLRSRVFGCQKRQGLLSVFWIVTFVCGILAVSSLLPGQMG